MAVIFLFLSHITGMILRFEEAHKLFLMRKNPLKGEEKTSTGVKRPEFRQFLGSSADTLCDPEPSS